jgi:MFS transporter, DHA1 family, tetracycline resistance protein
MSAPAIAAAPRRAALAFIFVTIVLDMLALGMIIPVLPHLIADFMGGDTAGAARVYGLFGTAWALMQFLSMPVMGALSDRFGRRRVILISNLGLGLDYVLMALAPGLAWLFAGRVISGICAASVSTGMAYVADVTPVERRSAAFGALGVAFGLGFVLGPALGGLLGSVDPRLPFWAAAAFSLLNALYGLFVLPESLPPARRRAFEWRRANPLGSLRLLRSHPGLFGLAGVVFLSNLAHAALPATFVLYADYRYGWGARDVGFMLAVIGICSAIVQGGLVGPLVRRFGERRVLLGGLASPAAQGLMTRRVGAGEQGELQGANGSVLGIATMIGPGLFAGTFAWFIGDGARLHVPGAAFLLASVLLAAGALLAARVTAK